MQVKTNLLSLYKNQDFTSFTGVPEGFDAFALLKLASETASPLVHICLDEARMRNLKKLIRALSPKQKIILFPAWDTLPYDRTSPNEKIIEDRVRAYEAFMHLEAGTLILTTLHAALQKLPPLDSIAGQFFSLQKGGDLDRDALQTYLSAHGYERSSAVREHGEYSFRGGIIDLFSPGEQRPIRLDLFGDEIESIRFFDPISQHSEEKIEGLDLKSASEIILSEASIKQFRAHYRRFFGVAKTYDLLYQAISEGRAYVGMEHWLACFHPKLVPLQSYLPRDFILTFDDQVEEARLSRMDQVRDFYNSRIEMRDIELLQAKKIGKDPAYFYNPVPISSMFISEEEWEDLTLGAKQLIPFSHSGMEGDLGAKLGKEFIEERSNPKRNIFDAFLDYIEPFCVRGKQVILACYSAGSAARLKHLLEQHVPEENFCSRKFFICSMHEAPHYPDCILLCEFPLARGFVFDDTLIITEQDILGDRMIRRPRKQKKSDAFIAEISSLNKGDLIIHETHGLGRFDGLVTIDIASAVHDCLKILYAGDDKLFVPVEQIEILSKYGESANANLDRLGGGAWHARKKQVKKRLKDMAEALLKIAAERALKKAEIITPTEGLYEEFIARFSYEMTEDQQKAITHVIEDLGSGKPMDRLICGDVGFGKTEIAMHAAFLAAMSGIQVALIVPTTLLARQHYQSFKKRFEGLPVKVETLSRLVTPKNAALVKKGLQSGEVNIVIGTHALLAGSIEFAHLGMLIIDEEQRFGVKQKEKLKNLRSNMHVLTLTATPIPRTLQLSLTGVRELSLIATPPIDRLAVRSFIMPFDPMIIREAIMREFYRGGQIYYVSPRVRDLEAIYKNLKKLVPEIKIVKAHGGLSPSALEDVMEAFDAGQFQLLLATTIVESGLDITNANTMIIHRSDMFGLAQLYQLRGRIGRGKVRGYAYLTYEGQAPMNKMAKKRLEVLETLDSLGAGFNLASYDMALRGAGNILGEEQSGQIKEVGVELYQKMLEETIMALKTSSSLAEDKLLDKHYVPQLNLGMAVQIPSSYVEDLNLRLSLYRRIACLEGEDALDHFAIEMVDRFGPMPEGLKNLLILIAMKNLCFHIGIEKIDAGPKGAIIKFYRDEFTEPMKLIAYINEARGRIKFRPDQRLLIVQNWEKRADRIQGVKTLLKDLSRMIA